MEKLHSDIVENILRRLPIESALQAKWVCKTWRSFVRGRIDEVGLLFAFSYYHYIENEIKLCYGDHRDPSHGKMNYSYSYDRIEKMQDDKSIKGYKYMDSMLGFMQRIFTGEVVYVPEPDKSIARDCLPTKISGFGYCHSTNEYKIVRMYSDYEEQKKYHVLVYTVGSGEWRNKGSINISPFDLEGIYANDALHWLHQFDNNQLHEDYTTVAFDLKDEKFQFIPLPGFDLEYKLRPKLLVGNNLYLYTIGGEPYCTDIWEYKRKNPKNTNGCDMKENYNDKNLWHWIKEFTIKWEEPYREDLRFVEPLTVTRNNEFLFRYRCMDLYCCDLKTSTLHKLFDVLAIDCNRINLIPHANSIVSMSFKGNA
ncbi:uncharacterized protein LOC113311527 [Papaver somniferum]|uniref:uncharacterized protein LOC113311527 n=1 Tax=Papaver somniferum TaxID=3469 RepID=UPI000E6F74E9|nr:uncharacterized protein LOC113311527 [Papaver somniferum]